MRYIVSACLAGEECRYDGRSNTVDAVVDMVADGAAIPVCPEVLGGLAVPRARCELHKNDDGSVEITGEDGRSYIKQFLLGAERLLAIAKENGITAAVLKSKSPSCGCGLIYDGTFSGKLVPGNGIAAELFIKSGIKVYTEDVFVKQNGSVKTST